MGKATSFSTFFAQKNPSSQEASPVVASLIQTTRKASMISHTYFIRCPKKKPQSEDLRPSHHQLPIPYRKSSKTNPKTHHPVIPLPFFLSTFSEVQNPSTQNLFQKGDYSITFNPLSTKATPKSSTVQYKRKPPSIDRKSNNCHHKPYCVKLIFIINPIYMQYESLLPGNPQIDQSQNLSAVQKLLYRVGGQGKYQLISFLVFVLLWFLTSWLLLGMSFFFDDSFTCVNPMYSKDADCRTYICGLKPDQRKEQIASHSMSIAFEFNDYMICEDFQEQIPVLQSMLFFGALIGFFIIPNIADNSGRKPALRLAWVIGIASVVITMIADSPRVIGFGLFFIGFGTNPAITLAFSFINEQTLGKSRQRFGVGVQLGLAVGQSTIALIFLSDMSWRTIMLILLVLFTMAYIPLELFLKETPMFLVEKSPHLTLKVLNEIAVINGRNEISQHEFDMIMPRNIQQEEGSQVGVKDLFKYKSMRWISIATGIIFLGIQILYYSTTLNLGDVGFNKTINQVIFGVSEMMGYIGAEFIIHKMPRKKASYFGLGIASGMCLVLGILLLFQNNDGADGSVSVLAWFQAAGLMINRFVLCGFWSIFYVYVAELYPTQTRSLGYGWTSVMGMIGSTLSPFITLISSYIGVNSWFPPAVVGLFCCLFIYKLPETFGKPLKDIIEELEKGHSILTTTEAKSSEISV